MPGISQASAFDKIAPAGLVTTDPFFAGGNTNGAQFTVAESRVGSNPMGPQRRYGNYKRTVAATGFVIHDIVGTPSTTKRRLRWYQTIVIAPSASAATVYITSAATNRLQVFTSTTRTVQLRNVTAAVGVASSALVLGRRYRFEWVDDPAASQQQLVVYDMDETTVFYDSGLVAAPSTASDRTQVRVGNTVSGTLEIDYSHFAEAPADQSAEIGPVWTPIGFGEAA